MAAIPVEVGIGELKLAMAPHQVLVAYGLGSCVALVMYDPVVGVGGMAHVMLPSNGTGPVGTPGKYADTAVEALRDGLLELGACRLRLRAKLSGGSQILRISGPAALQLNVGNRNVEAILRALKVHSIPVYAKDVGGNHARTVLFDPGTGIMVVRTANGVPLEI